MERYSNGTWTTVTQNPNGNALTAYMTCSGLAHGTYRIRMIGQSIYRNRDCPEGIKYFDVNGDQQLWDNTYPGRHFEPFLSYTVQLTVTTQNCAQWNVNEQDFFICPTGTGCKPATMVSTGNPVAIRAANDRLDIFNLDFTYSPRFTVTIINPEGKLLKQETVTSLQPIDISSFAAGIYVVHISDGAQSVFTGKFTK